MSTERETGMKDEHYDIVSALYHALQGAEASKKYISDAEQEGANLRLRVMVEAGAVQKAVSVPDVRATAVPRDG